MSDKSLGGGGQRRSWVLDAELYVNFVCQYKSRVQVGNSSEVGEGV